MSKRRWFQFSLRTCIIATGIAGVAVGVGVYFYQRHSILTIHVINESGGAVTLAGEYCSERQDRHNSLGRMIEDRAECYIEFEKGHTLWLNIKLNRETLTESYSTNPKRFIFFRMANSNALSLKPSA